MKKIKFRVAFRNKKGEFIHFEIEGFEFNISGFDFCVHRPCHLLINEQIKILDYGWSVSEKTTGHKVPFLIAIKAKEEAPYAVVVKIGELGKARFKKEIIRLVEECGVVNL